METKPIVQAILTRLSDYVANRIRADVEAYELLQQRIRTGRARRRRRYDLYLPPPPPPPFTQQNQQEQHKRPWRLLSVMKSALTQRSYPKHRQQQQLLRLRPPPQQQLQKTHQKEQQLRGLIFIPGALVDHTAYSCVASQLSDMGLIVVIMSLEPLRLAGECLGADADDIARIARKVSREKKPQWAVVRNTKDEEKEEEHDNNGSSEYYNNVQWSIGGHSMGGYAAFRLAPQLLSSSSSSFPFTSFNNRVVAWAMGHLVQHVADLSSGVDSHTELRVLIIQASRDAYCKFASRGHHDMFVRKLPKRHREVWIRGGNHSGFALYKSKTGVGGSSSSSGDIDGIATISRDAQQFIACSETGRFLLSS